MVALVWVAACVACEAGGDGAGGAIVAESPVAGVDTGGPVQLAVDADSVYWLYRGCSTCLETRYGGVLARAPKAGGEAQVLLHNDFANPEFQYPAALLVDGTHVYVATSFGLFRVPKGGGPVERFFEESNIRFLAQDDTHVYANTHAGPAKIARLAKATATEEPMVEPGVMSGPIAVDGTHIYVLPESDGLLRRIPKAGPYQPEQLVSVSPGSQPVALGVDATHLYWKTGERVHKLPREGGTPSTLGTVTPDGIRAGSSLVGSDSFLAQDAAGLYFPGHNGATREDGVSASLYRLAKTDGEREEVAATGGFTVPFRYAIDGSMVYWLDASLTVWRTPL